MSAAQLAMRSGMLDRGRHAVVRRACAGADVGGQRHPCAARKHLRQGRYRRRREQRQQKQARNDAQMPPCAHS